ncbi:MAG: NeuD/PglB/VioB family sugar acetyltransferase [Bacteroidota bacterium]
MKQPLLIIGAGNVGGFIAYNLSLFEQEFELIGFLDDDASKVGTNCFGYPVLGNTESLKDYTPDTSVAIGIASPQVKRIISQKVVSAGFQLPSLIAQNAWLSEGVKVGRGCIIYPHVSVNHLTNIGDFVIINMNCAIGHDCTIGNYCSLAPGVNLGGFTHLEEAIDFGIGACTIQNIKVGQSAVIGGQAMLIADVPPGGRVVGVPGRPLL